MVETSKQVRVDNWGVFFLSRLQVFFNKTDYCDLTLQFEGNVQLKVHRLVMNACTEYFQILEETCEVVDDVLMMPPELQADVILPIVNFMYTGMLEFQMSIFERLYKTAEMMNITVLLQLLDAQRQPKYANKLQIMDQQKQPKLVNKIQQQHAQGQKRKIEQKSNLPATLPGRKLPVWKRKHAPHNSSPTANSTCFASKPLLRKTLDPNFDNTPKPTRFEWPEDDLKNFSLLDSSFDNISYTSKPLLTQEEELRVRASTSFDSLRYLPTSNNGSKMKSGGDFGGSVDMDDLKSYVKEQKIRTDMVEFEDGDELIGEDDTVDDPDYVDPSSIKRTPRTSPSKKVKFNASEKENKEVKINLSPNLTTSPTSSKGDVDHTKIISEVLKKYPHLVKKNKNIRLKILAKSKDAKSEGVSWTSKVKYQVKNSGAAKAAKENSSKPNSPDDGPWTCQKCLAAGEEVEFVLYYLYRKHMTDVHNEKFDSRMCKYCGHKSTKHNMLMYHQYTKHGIKPPPAYNFPKCHLCPYVALTEALMIKHKLNHTKFHLQCPQCKIAFNNETALNYHTRITGHTLDSNPIRNQYDCQYCTKHYQSGANLFSHIRLVHRDEARRDGIVSLDEDEGEELDELDEETAAKKIKILSDVSLHEEKVEAETQQETQQLPTNLNLVDIVVLDDNQQYIQQEFIPNLTFNTNSDITSTDELVMVLTDHDYNDGNNLTEDNSNIVVLYSHPVEGVEGVVQQQGQFITTTARPGEGGLMLNSETGMLELKDSSESIELIQREIERHGNNNAGGNGGERKAVVELPQQETVINIPDSTASFHHTEEETLIHQHHHNEEHQTQPEMQAAYIVQEVPQEVDDLQQQNIIDGNNEHEHQEQIQEEQQEQQNEEHTQLMEVDEEITSTELAVPLTENSEDVQQLQEEENKVEEERGEDSLLEMMEKSGQAVLLEDEQEDIPQEAAMEAASEVEETVEHLQTEEEEKVKQIREVKVEENKFQQERENVIILDENMQIIQQTTIPVTTEMETTENILIQEQEEKPSEDVEIKEGEDKKITEHVEQSTELEQKEESKEKEEIMQPSDIIEEPEKTSDTIKTCDTIETDDPSPNNEEKTMDEHKTNGANVISNQDEEVSGLTMSSTTTETETLEAIVANEKKMEGEVKSATAKSLLDDWEDTDSQQSEHGEKSNSSSVNTVNKLINDWDDD